MINLRHPSASPNVIMGIAIGVCLLATAGAYWLGIEPALRHVDDLAREQGVVVEKTEALRDSGRNLQQTRERLSQVNGQIASSKLSLEDAGELNRKVSRLVQLAERHRLVVSELRPQTATRSGPYTVVPLTFAAVCSYVDLQAFFAEARKSHPDVVLRSLVITRGGTATRPLTVQATLRWHALPLGAPVVSAAAISEGSR